MLDALVALFEVVIAFSAVHVVALVAIVDSMVLFVVVVDDHIIFVDTVAVGDVFVFACLVDVGVLYVL